MSAVRMEYDNSITVLINPWTNEDKQNIAKGVFLTRSYKNPSGVLPQEHIFISNDERWFYWLGYYKDFQKEVPDTTENNDIVEKIINYINEFSSGRQLDISFQEVEKLKENWKNDPCWNLYKTEGFEEYRDELKNFQEECEKEWQRITKEMRLDMEAESLGVKGLYRLILEHNALLDRHQRAIEALAGGEPLKAYRILQKT